MAPHVLRDLLVIDLTPKGRPRPADIPAQASEILDATNIEDRLRELLQIGPEGGIRGIATCAECDVHSVLWYGSHHAVRTGERLSLGDLTEDQYQEVRRLLTTGAAGTRSNPST